MASTSSHSVFVLEGNYSVLRGLGFPTSALAAMQEAGALISKACWDVKQSNTGLSGSFFWPTCLPTESQSKPSIVLNFIISNNYSKSKKRRLRRKKQLRSSVKREEDCCTRLQSPVEARLSPERASVSESGLSPGVQPECNDHLTSGTDDTSRTESSTSTFEGFEDQPEMVTVYCCTKPTVAIDLSDAVIVDSSNVYYQELEDSPTPGVCVESDGGTSTWSPIKISKRHVKPASSDTSDDDIDIDDCLSFDYQLRDGVPGFEIETRDDCFWAPILNRRTRSRKKLHQN